MAISNRSLDLKTITYKATRRRVSLPCIDHGMEVVARGCGHRASSRLTSPILAVCSSHPRGGGTALLTVDFASEEEARRFKPPAWFGPEVSDINGHSSGAFALHGLPETREITVSKAGLDSLLDALETSTSRKAARALTAPIEIPAPAPEREPTVAEDPEITKIEDNVIRELARFNRSVGDHRLVSKGSGRRRHDLNYSPAGRTVKISIRNEPSCAQVSLSEGSASTALHAVRGDAETRGNDLLAVFLRQ